MCTAIRLTTRDHYFGRNLDLEYSYQETVAITPRRYPFHFRHEGDEQRPFRHDWHGVRRRRNAFIL